MKILFVTEGGNSPSRQLAEEAEKLVGKDAEVSYYDPALPLVADGIDGVWIFTREEEGGCPEEIENFLERLYPAFADVPVLASGVGGKDGGMNALAEIRDYIDKQGGRYAEETDPLSIPLRSARLSLDPEEKWDLFFVVDAFLKYCGMDESESRKIGFSTVVEDFFKLMKFLSPEGPRPHTLTLEGFIVRTDVGEFDCSVAGDDVPPEIKELRYEIESLVSDYEIGDEEIAPALLQKIETDWEVS